MIVDTTENIILEDIGSIEGIFAIIGSAVLATSLVLLDLISLAKSSCLRSS